MKVRREGTHKIACGWCLLAVADVVANANLQILVLNWSHSAKTGAISLFLVTFLQLAIPAYPLLLGPFIIIILLP